MGRIRNTIELAKTSWGVLQKDRELVVLPVLSFLGAALVLAIFVIPGVLALPRRAPVQRLRARRKPFRPVVDPVRARLARRHGRQRVLHRRPRRRRPRAHERRRPDRRQRHRPGHPADSRPRALGAAHRHRRHDHPGAARAGRRRRPIHPRWHRSRLECGVVPHHPGDRDRRQGADRRLQVVGRPPSSDLGREPRLAGRVRPRRLRGRDPGDRAHCDRRCAERHRVPRGCLHHRRRVDCARPRRDQRARRHLQGALYLYATRGQAPEGFEGADLAGTFTRR